MHSILSDTSAKLMFVKAQIEIELNWIVIESRE